MIKKTLILFMLVTMLIIMGLAVTASLGTYEAGDTVVYTVVCLEDGGKQDTGCSSPNSTILSGNDSTGKSPTLALAEVSDTYFPGLWRGNYSVEEGSYVGTWSIYIRLTNTNGTAASTVLHFQVANNSFQGLSDYVDVLPASAPESWDDSHDADDIMSSMASNFSDEIDRFGIINESFTNMQTISNMSFTNLHAALFANFTYVFENNSVIWTDMSLNFTGVNDRLSYINASFTNMQDISNASFTNLHAALSANYTILNDSITGYGDQSWVSAMTSAQNASLNAIESNLTDSTYGLSAIKTYLTGTVYPLLASIWSDIGLNFTDVKTYGDTNWATAMTSAQNDTLNAIHSDMALNFSDITGRFGNINTSFDNLHSALSANFTSVNNGVLTINGSIIGHGDLFWTATLTVAQNSTLNAIHSDMGLNFTADKDRFGSVNTTLSNINTTLYNEINATPNKTWQDIWTSDRILTAYPVGAIASIVLTDEGFFNATFYNSEVGHIFGEIDPENSLSLQAGRWAQNHLVVEDLPSNITQTEICLWLKKTGNPTGNLGVYMNDTFMYNISTAVATTNWAKNCTEVGTGNVTNYNPITLRGESGWIPANRIDVGMDDQASIYSYLSTDSGVSWTHTTQELITWIEVTAYATSIADQINAKVVNVETYTPFSPCVGKAVNFHWAFYDFKGIQLTIDSMPPTCNMYYYITNGSEVNITTADITTKIENSYIAWAFWNNTENENVNRSYHIDCNEILVTPPSGTQQSIDVDALFGFSEECELDRRFGSIDGNLTEVDTSIANLGTALEGNKTYLNNSLTIRFNKVDTDNSNIFSDMGLNFTEMSDRFSSVDGNVTELDTELANIQTSLVGNFSAIDSDFTSLNVTLGSVWLEIRNTNTSLTGRFDNVDVSLSEISSGVSDNTTYIVTQTGIRFNGVDGNLTELDTALTDVNISITGYVEGRADTIDSALSDLSGGVTDNFTALNLRFDAVDGNISYVNGTVLLEIMQEVVLTNVSVSDLIVGRFDLADTRFDSIADNINDANQSISTYLYAMYDKMLEVNISISTQLLDSTFGLSVIKTYLVDTIYDYLVNTIYPSVDEIESLTISINESLSNLLLNESANTSLILDQVQDNWELMTNTSLDASVIEYLHRQNITEVWYYNGTWQLANRTVVYSDGVQKRLSFDYNDDGFTNKSEEVTY